MSVFACTHTCCVCLPAWTVIMQYSNDVRVHRLWFAIQCDHLILSINPGSFILTLAHQTCLLGRHCRRHFFPKALIISCTSFPKSHEYLTSSYLICANPESQSQIYILGVTVCISLSFLPWIILIMIRTHIQQHLSILHQSLTHL